MECGDYVGGLEGVLDGMLCLCRRTGGCFRWNVVIM
jgi:hypothetical protein